jgi:hypothetical protein
MLFHAAIAKARCVVPARIGLAVGMLALAAATARADIIISQVYSGTSPNRWVEITNTGAAAFTFSTTGVNQRVIKVWSFTGDTGTHTTADSGSSISTYTIPSVTLQPGASYLVRASGATTPAYALLNTGSVGSPVGNISGNDPVALTDGSGNILDLFGNGINYANSTYVRQSYATSASATFISADWTADALSAADTPTLWDSAYLGYHSFNGGLTAPNVSGFTASSPAIVSGQSVTLAATATGDSGRTLIYSYYKGSPGDTSTLLSTTNSATVSSGALTANMSFWVRVKYNGYSLPYGDSTGATVLVNAPPQITKQPTSQGVVQGGNVTLTVVAFGSGSLSYQWVKNDGDISGQTGASLSLTNVTGNDSGDYKCRITNTYGTTTSDVATVSVQAPPGISYIPGTVNVATGGSGYLYVTATGDAPLSYQWYLGASGDTSNPVSGANADTYNTPALSGSASYWVRISNAVGHTDSGTVSVVVGNAPTITSPPGSAEVVAGTDVQFSVSATGDGTLNYYWEFNGSSISGAHSSILQLHSVTAADAGTYRAIVANEFGTAHSDATLTVHAPPSIIGGPTGGAVVVGGTANLSVTAGGDGPLSYQWYKDNQPISGAVGDTYTISPVSTDDTGSYKVVVQNPYGSATGGPVTLSIGSPVTVIGQNPIIKIARGTSTNLSVTVTGSPQFHYVWYEGSSGDTSNVVKDETSSITTSSYTTTTLSSNANFWVRVSNPYGDPADSATLTVELGDLASITTQPASTTITQGFPVNLEVVATSDSPMHYQWYKEGAVVDGAAGSTFTDSPTITTHYSVHITNDYGTAISDTATVTVNHPPAITGEPQTLFKNVGDSGTFTVTATGDPTLTYQWRKDDADISNATGASYTINNIQVADAAQYSVVVTNDFGTAYSSEAELVVAAPPVISTQPKSATVNRGDNVNLSVAARGTGPFTYQWYLGTSHDTSNPVGINSASFNTGSLTADSSYWVRVTNSYGPVDSNAATITVTQPIPVITSATSASITAGSLFGYNIAATYSPNSFAATPLPDGVTVDPATGVIQGAPTVPGTYSIGLSASNGLFTGTATLQLVVLPVAPVVTSASSLEALANQPFTYQVTATGSPTSYLINGKLSWMTFNTATGALTGTPPSPGNYPVQVGAANGGGIGYLNVLIHAGSGVDVPAITSSDYAVARVEQSFSFQLTATNSPTGFFFNSLPDGLVGDMGTGVISGVPTTPGDYTASVGAQNAGGPGLPASLHIRVLPKIGTPVVNSPNKATGARGQAFSFQVTATNGPTYFTASNLPSGLTINPGTGVISGSATTLGSFTSYVTAANSSGRSDPAQLYIVISAPAGSPVISSNALATGYVDEAFSFQLTASDNPSSFILTGSLPQGLAFNSSTGLISGMPGAAADVTVSISAVNGVGEGAPASLEIKINPPRLAPVILSGNEGVIQAQVGVPFRYTLNISYSPTSVSATDLPDGLHVTTAPPFLIYGVPTTARTNPPYTATLTATNQYGTGAPKEIQFRVIPPNGAPVINSNLQASGRVGSAFYYQVTATNAPTGFTATPMPAGLSFNQKTGVLSGTPQVAGTYNIALTASNSIGQSEAATLVLSVKPAPILPQITSPSAVTGTVAQPFSYQITATNGPILHFNSTALPDGLTLDPLSGVISGTPVHPKTYTANISATNADGTGAAQTLTFYVQPVAGTSIITSAQTYSIQAGQDVGYILKATNLPNTTPLPAGMYFATENLPASLQLNAGTGVISGSLTAGTYSFDAWAVNTDGEGEHRTITFNVAAAPSNIQVLKPAILTGTTGQPLNFTIESSPAASLYYFLDLGANGINNSYLFGTQKLSISNTSGAFTVIPTSAGQAEFTSMAVKDGVTATRETWVVISPTPDLPSITSAGSISGVAGQTISYQIQAVNGATYYEWIAPLALPTNASVNLNAYTGLLTVNFTQPGVYVLQLYPEKNGFVGLPKILQINVSPASGTPVISGVSVGSMALRSGFAKLLAPADASAPDLNASGQVGVYFDFAVSATGSPTSFTVTSLPPGITINEATGELSGVPTEPGTWNTVMQAENDTGIGGSVTIAITINAADGTPEITSPLTASGQSGETFTYTIEADNSPTSFNVSNLSGFLTFDSTTGTLSGTPDVPGVYDITIGANNDIGTGMPVTLELTVSEKAGAPMMTSATYTTGNAGSPFSFQLTATNSPNGFVVDKLPVGLTIDETTGLITGTPFESGSQTVNVYAENGTGRSASQSLVIDIASSLGAPAITSGSSATFVVGKASTFQFTASNAPTSFNAGALPAWLAFDSVTGELSGTPPAVGSYDVAFSANNAAGEGLEIQFALTVIPDAGKLDGWADLNLPDSLGYTAADRDPLANPAKDGLANLLKFAFGLDPSASAAIPPFSVSTVTQNGHQYLAITYRHNKNATGITITVESSPSLASGSWSEVTTTPQITPIDSDTEQVTVVSPYSITDLNRQFLHIVVKLNASP